MPGRVPSALALLLLSGALGFVGMGCSAASGISGTPEAETATSDAPDRAAAEALYAAGEVEAAAAAFRWLSEASPRDPDLHYNLGSACLALHAGAGDLGCALLAYERAARLAPRDGGIAQALAEARARAGRQAGAEGSRFAAPAAWDWLAGELSMDDLLLGLLLAWNILALVWLGSRRRGSGGPAAGLAWRGTAAVLFLLLVLTLGRWLDASARPSAVLTAAESQQATAGPGPAGEARPKLLIAPGSSLRILEHREGYLRARLAGQDESFWLPAGVLTEIAIP